MEKTEILEVQIQMNSGFLPYSVVEAHKTTREKGNDFMHYLNSKIDNMHIYQAYQISISNISLLFQRPN